MNETLSLWPIFLTSFLLALALTPLVRLLAIRAGAIAIPGERHIHPAPQPRWGGLALFISFVISVLIFVPTTKHHIGLLLGAAVLVVVGLIDDRLGVGPWWKLFWQVIASLVIVAVGVGIDFITNPLGGVIRLDQYEIPIALGDTTYHATLFADLFTIFWIVAVVNTMNFLDGLDGLASGVGAIAALVIAGLSLSPLVDQPITAALALALAGAALGFLPYNFHPARIFLGDTGSMFLGYVIGVLAIISGSKVATALLVLGFPLLDVAWAVVRRGARGVSPFRPDRYHFHHRLLDVGLSQRRAVLLMYLLSLLFGSLALISTSRDKLYLLIVLGITMTALLAAIFFLLRSRSLQKKEQ